jgi:hypothetical protein
LGYWIGGTAIALLGVAVARLIRPELPEQYQLIAMIGGSTLGVIGIFIAALGANRRKSSPPSKSDIEERSGST